MFEPQALEQKGLVLWSPEGGGIDLDVVRQLLDLYELEIGDPRPAAAVPRERRCES